VNRPAPTLLAVALTALGALLLWWGATRPVAVAGGLEGRLRSLSFSPYRASESPLLKIYPSEAELDADLALIAGVAEGIRTYSSLEGLDRVPRLAARHGLRVTLGGWLGSDPRHNRQEIEALVRVANAHPGTVTRVIVGNEVLVRCELTLDTLIGYLREVRARVRQPVSYADVPEVWRFYPRLGAEVDFVTVHILPYWVDRGVPYAQAERYLLDQVTELRGRFPGKPLLVGESGWPADGRPRGPALPGRAAQAGYLRMLARVAALHGFDYNLIEAFDQPWKGALEGRVGAHWGLFTFERTLKYPPTGPIEPMPGWPWRAVPALLAGAGLTLLAARRAGLGGLPALLGWASAAQGLSALTVLATDRLLGDAFTPLALAWALLTALLLAALAAGSLLASVRILAGSREDRHPGLLALFLASLLLLLVHSARLVLAGHLLDIPVLQPAVPAACLLLLALLRRLRGLPWGHVAALHELFDAPARARPPRTRLRRPALLGGLLLLATALGVLVSEAFEAVAHDFGRDQDLAGRLATAWSWLGAGPMANAWSGLLVLLAVPFAATARLAAQVRPGAE